MVDWLTDYWVHMDRDWLTVPQALAVSVSVTSKFHHRSSCLTPRGVNHTREYLSPIKGKVQCRSLQPSNSRGRYLMSWAWGKGEREKESVRKRVRIFIQRERVSFGCVYVRVFVCVREIEPACVFESVWYRVCVCVCVCFHHYTTLQQFNSPLLLLLVLPHCSLLDPLWGKRTDRYLHHCP